MVFIFCNNPSMDILTTIATNLNRWMDQTPGLRTIEEVTAASGVGFGTVRRVRNGQINATIEKLEDIARAFNKHATDLLTPVGEIAYVSAPPPKDMPAKEKSADVLGFKPKDQQPLIDEATRLMHTMSEAGQRMALRHIKLCAEEYPIKTQTNKLQ